MVRLADSLDMTIAVDGYVTVNVLKFQTLSTFQISTFLKKQSDLGLPCLLF